MESQTFFYMKNWGELCMHLNRKPVLPASSESRMDHFNLNRNGTDRNLGDGQPTSCSLPLEAFQPRSQGDH